MVSSSCLAGGLDEHGVEREAWLSWYGEVIDAQHVHLLELHFVASSDSQRCRG